MKTIDLNCGTCKKNFQKATNEYTRQIKAGRQEFFCSRSCAAVKNNAHLPHPGNPKNLKSDNRRDEYTPFRWFVNRGNYRGNRKRKYGCNITVEFLKQLWEEQKGKCPFTGWELILPKDTAYAWNEKHPANASLDRIDNTIGYMRGNVRFVSLMANLARQTFSDEQVEEFCQSVINNKNNK